MINDTTSQRVVKIMPFQEAVTYYRRTANDTFTSSSVSKAHQKKISLDDPAFPPDILLKADVIWQFTSQYISFVPAINDYLIDASGVTWYVIFVTEQFHRNVYNCVCRKGS